MLGGVLLALAASMGLVDGMSLVPRQTQSQAICASSYQWMNNHAGDTPCQVAAKLGGICNSGTWIIRSLVGPNGTVDYTYPNPMASDRTANFCTCSWSYYNLLSACTACQGAEFQVQFWSNFKSGCSGLESSDYFPSNYTLPPSVAIPFWAGTNPTTWNSNQRFDVNRAQQIAGDGKSDLGSVTAAPAGKKSNIGAIVGGVIGGIVVLGAAIAIAIFILRRNKKKQQPAQSNQMQNTGDTSTYGHMRSFSDATQKSNLTSSGHIYSTLTSTPMFTNPPVSPTIQTHPTSSVRSIPYLGSLIASSASPPPQGGNISRQQTPPVNREDIVVPYTEPPNGQEFSDRKHTGGPGIVYDSPDAPPPNVAAMRMEIIRPSTPPRTRFNPPAYSETTLGTSAGPSSTPRLAHAKKGSADTNHSFTSSVPRASSPPISLVPPPATPLAIYNPTSPQPPPEHPSHGRQLSGPSRDEKRNSPQSPQSDSFYGGDLA